MGSIAIPAEQEKIWRTTGWATFSNSRSSKIELPYEFYVDRQQYNAVDIVRGLDVPTLLIAGAHDDVVPSSTVREIFEAAREPKTYREFPTGHDYKFDAEQLRAINDTTVEFFVEVLT